MSNTSLYGVWTDIKRRCYNPWRRTYYKYGARGIRVCDEWRHSFIAFHEWALASGYREGYQIDRIDDKLDYEPDNCRWVTIRIQNLNRKIPITNTSGYRGVGWFKPSKKWRASIKVNNVTKHIGLYDTPIAAAYAYDEAAIRYNGVYARLNFPEGR